VGAGPDFRARLAPYPCGVTSFRPGSDAHEPLFIRGRPCADAVQASTTTEIGLVEHGRQNAQSAHKQ